MNDLISPVQSQIVNEGTRTSRGVGASAAAHGPSFDQVLNDAANFQGNPEDLDKLFQMQLAIQRETLLYTSISNIAKARHEAAMNSVRNVKS